MTKSINTLVEDIKDVLVSRELDKKTVSDFGQRLAAVLVDRLCEGSHKNELRMSNFGYPDRKLWYYVNTPGDAEPLSAETRLKFLYGDIIEELMVFLAKQSGHEVGNEQKKVSLHDVVGHIDCTIDGVVVDVKSANARSFDKFQYHNLDEYDPFGYRDQLSLYVSACRDLPDVAVKKQGSFLAVDKELGRIVLDTYNNKEINYETETKRKTDFLAKPDPPDRCYPPVPHGSSGNAKLGVECVYCPFKKKCWPEMKTFRYSNGDVHLVKVVRMPDVPEVT